ncbi:MAG: hypothetical protein ACK4MX_00845 [Thermaurantiacus sp.]
MTEDGKPLESWPALLEQLGLPLLRDDAPLAGVVFAPGENRHLLRITGPAAEALRVAVDSGRVSMSVCHCSVFDQCWRVDPSRASPEPQAACPEPGPGSFAG